VIGGQSRSGKKHTQKTARTRREGRNLYKEGRDAETGDKKNQKCTGGGEDQDRVKQLNKEIKTKGKEGKRGL